VECEYLESRSSSHLARLEDVERICDNLRSGGLAILPTETGHMLSAVATQESAVMQVFAAKGRSLSNPIHVACSSLSMAEKFADLNVRASRLLGHLTPGPVTVVVPKRSLLPDSLVTLNGTVGIRVPDYPATLQVIEALGEPVTATSLNRSGEAPVAPSDQAIAELSWPATVKILTILDRDAKPLFNRPSTLVRVTGPESEVLREGPFSADEVKAVAARRGYLEVSDWT
jgi:L-threonylcarbamoyladenylate synthase